MSTETTEPVEAPQQENLLKKFDYAHLPEELHAIGRPFYALAHHLEDVLPKEKLAEVLGHLASALAAALAETVVK